MLSRKGPSPLAQRLFLDQRTKRPRARPNASAREAGKPGDQGELLVILRQMASAYGGVQAIAAQAQLNPTQLYRTLSPDGNPALSSLSAILKAMGLRLAVLPAASAHA